MNKTRVPKGEKYWFINTNAAQTNMWADWDIEGNYPCIDKARFENGNYFNTKEDAEVKVMKLRAVLAGADVIEWHKASEELPPVDTEVVCKMKGVPHTKHFICKWDGEYWLTWNYCGEAEQGWFGLNKGWEVTEWKEI